MNMILGGGMLGGGLDKITGTGEAKDPAKAQVEEDPELIQAKLEAEEQRREKHKRMEDDREKLRNNIRDKYGLQKTAADESANQSDLLDKNGVGGGRPSDAGLPKEEAGLMGQVTGLFDKAKTQVTGVVGTVKGLLPFGK